MPPIRHCSGPVRLLAIAAVMAATSAQAVVREDARALSRDTGRLLYHERHLQYDERGVTRRIVLYRCPDGAAFARKLVVARGAPTQPDFAFHDGRSGYREGVRTRDGRREIFVDDGRGDLRVRPLPSSPDAVIDVGFDAAVRARWEELAGAPQKLSFLMPDRFAFMPVQVASAHDAAGQRRLRMSIDRWFGFAIAPIELRYDLRDRRLLEYSGPGSVRDARGRPREVRIVFPDASRTVTRRDVDDALAVPLDGRCVT